MITTERATAKVPVDIANRARAEWPETREMSTGQLLKFALIFALTGDRKQALSASGDARIGTKRT